MASASVSKKRKKKGLINYISSLILSNITEKHDLTLGTAQSFPSTDHTSQ